MGLGDRLKHTLSVAGLSPRNLGGATRIHYATIYRAMKNGGATFPSHEHSLVNALSKIETLVARGDLPMVGQLSKKEKTDRLIAMLADHS